MQTNPAVER